jgi:2-oxoisovalerate dehydrogenase E1 component
MTETSPAAARSAIAAQWAALRQGGNAGFLGEAYRRMQRIRLFEKRCLELSGGTEPLIAGSLHLCAGHEAVPVGALAVLAPEDRVIATYRGHGWLLECGVPLEAAMAEICHRATGINGGRAGSAYMAAPEYGFLGENSIVGAGAPVACGAAMAARAAGQGRVVLVSFGDGAMSQGALHEAMVFAAAERLPLIMVCEHNGWSELTLTADLLRVDRLARRAEACGIPAVTIDGCDSVAVADAIGAAAATARAGGGPSFVECRTVRLWGHYNGDTEHYRPKADRAAAAARDPVALLRGRLLAEGMMSAAELDAADADLAAAIEAAIEAARAAPLPDPASARQHVIGPAPVPAPGPMPAAGEERTFAAAVTQALREELAARPELLVYGEDVGVAGGVFGISRGLQKEFGVGRVFDTPIAESAILGSGVGAALEGMRPVVEIMWTDFLMVALDQLVNQAANVRYISRGTRGLPLVVRTQQGATPGSCAQHSQSLEALLAHIPGLRLGMPSCPQDAYAMLRAAIAVDDPCVIIESRALYRLKGPLAAGGAPEPIGGARLRREGGDLAIISWGRMVNVALEAAEALAADGIAASVLDLRWLAPLDTAAIDAAVAGCGGRVLVVHEANRTAGFGAEVAAGIAERGYAHLRGPVARLATPDSRIPASPLLQQQLIPGVAAIRRAAQDVAAGRPPALAS